MPNRKPRKAKQRRGAGEGSVYQDSRGLYCAAVELGDGPAGQRLRKVVRSKTKAGVLAKLRKVQEHQGKGLPLPDAQMSVKAWCELWLTDVLPGTVKPRTEDDYAWLLRKYVIPSCGKVRLLKLGPEHVQRMLRTMEDSGLSPRTRAYTRTVLRRCLTDAQAWSLVHRNAAALTRAPKRQAAKLDDALDAAQVAAVLDAARQPDADTGEPDRLAALAVLVLAVGLRQGEALALRWPDVDLAQRRLTVQDAKTPAGVRTVALPAFVVAALKAHKAQQRREHMAAARWDDADLVFASTVGTTLDPRNVLRWWHALTERAGVGRRRFHASRPTAGTLMLNNGVPLEVVSATLGHASLAITADIYAKVRPQMQAQAADAMQQLLGGTSSRARKRR